MGILIFYSMGYCMLFQNFPNLLARMWSVLVVCFGCVALLLCATTSSHAIAAQDCRDARTQKGLNACAQASFEAATAEDAAAYKTLADHFSARQKSDLKTAQKAWLAYRTAACNLESSGVEGGSARPMVNLQCATRMTISHTAELVKLANCPEGDLSCPRSIK